MSNWAGEPNPFCQEDDDFILNERFGATPTPFKEIARLLGRETKQVASRAQYLKRRELRRAGLLVPSDHEDVNDGSKGEPLTDERIGRVRAMESFGFSSHAIAKHLRLSPMQRAVLFKEELPHGPHRDLTTANIAHLIDLKRAGYSPRKVNYDITPGDMVRPFKPDHSWRSYGASPAGQCALEVGYRP